MFNLSFINSIFLSGLLLAGIPFIIHLVNKKRAITLKFPTIRFVLESNKRVAKKFKLRQLILLLLRTLAIILLVFLFARPLLSSKENALDYANMTRSTVIIIDNSFSMLYRDISGNFFKSALASAESLITGQKNVDRAAILTTCENAGQSMEKLNYNKEELIDALKGVKTQYTRSDVLKQFKSAIDMIKAAPSQANEIYFISDMQKNGWDIGNVWAEGLKKSLQENNINVYLVDVAFNKKIDNAGITSVSATKESKGKINILNIFSKIKNFSGSAADNLLIKCFIGDEEVVKGFVTLSPFDATDKNLFAPIDESGIIKGHMSLKGDSFAPDDIRYFSLKSYRTVRTLVVDGDPTTQVYQSETFYLDFGLNPIKEMYSKIESKIVTYDEFLKTELANYDVVLLCNLEGATKNKVQELKTFAKKGGGVIFFLGNKVDPVAYNETFGDLLPQKLRDVFTKKENAIEKPFEYIEVSDYSHPILAPFSGAESGDLSIGRFYKYFILQPSMESKSNIILEFSDGNPCIVEKNYFGAKVLMYTSSADRDFNDLCIYPTYLPLMQQMTLYAASALGKEAYSELSVEDGAEFSVDKEITDVTIVDPAENLHYIATTPLKDIAKVKFDATYYPGFYNVFSGKLTGAQVSGAEPINTFAVNVTTGESDFTKIDEKVLKNIFSNNYSYVTKSGDLSEVKLQYLRGEEIWSKLLIYLIIFLLIESIISSSWRKKKEIKSAKWKEEGLI